MSTPAAIVLAAFAVVFTAWFLGLTRNGHRVVYLAWLIAVAVHRQLISATGEHGLNQAAGVRKTVRDMAIAAAWHMPRYWWWRQRAASLVRGCLPHPQTLRSRAEPEPEEVPALLLPGRAPGTHPYPLRVTAAQPRLDEPANPARGYAPPADWTPYGPAVTGYLP